MSQQRERENQIPKYLRTVRLGESLRIGLKVESVYSDGTPTFLWDLTSKEIWLKTDQGNFTASNFTLINANRRDFHLTAAEIQALGAGVIVGTFFIATSPSDVMALYDLELTIV